MDGHFPISEHCHPLFVFRGLIFNPFRSIVTRWMCFFSAASICPLTAFYLCVLLSIRNQRLVKEANFRYSATLEQIQAGTQRGIDPNRLALLAMGSYVANGESILITGAAGVGKSYLATALGNKACNQGYKVTYWGMQKLLTKIKLARIEGTIVKLLLQIQRTDLLIIDDFGMKTLEPQQQNDFMEIIEDRHARKATIIASQLPVSKWYDVIGNEVIVDAILDRIVHTSHRFDLKGESLRKKM